MHHGAGDEDRAFERVGGLAVELVGDGGEQAVLAGDEGVAGVQQREAAGAVGGFEHAGFEAGLADGGGLLVAGDAEDGDFAAEEVGAGHAELGGAVADLRQHGEGDVEELADVGVPAAFADVVEQGAGGVGGVGDVGRPAGELPDEVAVDGAEEELAAGGAVAGAFGLVEDPFELGAGEVGVEDEAGAFGDHGLMAFGAERGADLGGAAVLPDDGVVQGLRRSSRPRRRWFRAGW